MPMKIEKTLNMRELNAELTILPMHAKTMQKPLTLHRSMQDLCFNDYPHAYSFYKYKEKDGLARGFLLTRPYRWRRCRHIGGSWRHTKEV